MANYCSNCVVFLGDVTTIKSEIETMQNENLKTDYFQYPLGYVEEKEKAGERVSSPAGMFDIHIINTNEKSVRIEYESRWTISIDALAFLARKHGVQFYAFYCPDDNAKDWSGIAVGVDGKNGFRTKQQEICEIRNSTPTYAHDSTEDLETLAVELFMEEGANPLQKTNGIIPKENYHGKLV